MRCVPTCNLKKQITKGGTSIHSPVGAYDPFLFAASRPSQIVKARAELSPLVSSPLLSEQESKSKSHATHALTQPLLVYVDRRKQLGLEV
jgi:hypothetical protein